MVPAEFEGESLEPVALLGYPQRKGLESDTTSHGVLLARHACQQGLVAR